MPPINPRSTLDFDPGIGGEAIDDPLAHSALAGLQKAKQAAYQAQVQQAQAPEPQPPPAPTPALQPPADEYRARNPSLPSMPFETVKHLPSMGKAYPDGTSIRYRPYTLGEAIYAEESKLDMRGTYGLILKGLECQGVNPYQLTLPDVLFLGLVRKIASLGATKVNVTTTCPFCSGLNRTPIECTALEFDDLQVPKLPIRAPFSFGEHSFMPLTLERYLELLDRELEDDFVALMAAQCTTDLPLEQRMELLNGMTDPDDIAMLKQIDELLHHELKPVNVTCPQELGTEEGDEPAPTCGKRYPVALDDVSAAFILPFSGGRADRPKREIAFG